MMIDDSFDVQIPWIIDEDTELILIIHDSADYRRLRHRVLARDLPHECRRCNYAAGLC